VPFPKNKYPPPAQIEIRLTKKKKGHEVAADQEGHQGVYDEAWEGRSRTQKLGDGRAITKKSGWFFEGKKE